MKNTLCRFPLAAAMFLVILAAKASDPLTPEAVAASYFNALKSNDYLSAARLYRASDLDQFKAIFVPLYEAESRDGKRNLLNATFGNSATVDTAISATPEQLFSNVVSFIFNASSAVRASPERMQILGVVEEKPAGLVHVLARNYVTVGDVESSKVEVLTMTNESSKWKMVMPDQMKAIGQVIRNSMNAR